MEQLNADIQQNITTLLASVVEERKRQHLTQKDIARRTGIPQPELSRVETGQTIPTMNTFLKIVCSLGMTVTLCDPSE